MKCRTCDSSRGRMGPPNTAEHSKKTTIKRPRTRSSSDQQADTNKTATSAANSKEHGLKSDVPSPYTLGPRISKARKALNFDFDDKKCAQGSADASLSIIKDNVVTLESGRLPRIPPLQIHGCDDNLSLPPPDYKEFHPARRRSERLNQNHELNPIPTPNPVEPDSAKDMIALDHLSVHSDYGTASEKSFTLNAQAHTAVRRGKRRGFCLPRNAKKRKVVDLDNPEAESSQSQGYGTDLEREDDNLSDLILHELGPESLCNSRSWDSDEDYQVNLEKRRKVEEWDCMMELADDNSMSSSHLVSNLSRIRNISYHGVRCLIPLGGYQLPPGDHTFRNQSGSHLSKRRHRLNYPTHNYPDLFSIQTFYNIDVESSLAKKGLRVISASPVVSLEPHGTKFCDLYPAFVSIPLEVYPSRGDEIYCLYSLSSNEEGLKWCVHPNVRFTVDKEERTTVSFETFEFCYFVVVIREKSLMATKQIRSRIGGRLIVPDSMIEINFPRGSVPEDIVAKVKVHLDTELSLPDFLEEGFQSVCLASPILLLEPHGRVFAEGVTIRLPIPDYYAIMERFGPQARLTIWESRTDENELPDWKLLEVEYTVSQTKQTPVISFKVTHFSFFRAVWDLISASLYDAKVGVSYFYPYISFPMKCQANMEESTERNSFGLEVICYRSDKTLPMPELTNYVHKVGASSKPKLVRPGKITVRLKSLIFEADVEAGEDPSLEKEEADFRGRDFEMQYACKFKPDNKVDRGTFGKVIVKRILKAGNEEALFEFNLQKSGNECEITPNENTDRWSNVALKDLATNFFITDGDNWKLLARHLGFTNSEIRRKLKTAPDPFRAMVLLYQQRQGTPEEFVRILHVVHRELKLNGGFSPGSNASRSSNGSSGLGSLPGKFFRGASSDSDTSGTQISQDSLLNGTRKRSNPSINRSGSGSNDKGKRKKIKLSRQIDNDSSSSGNRSTAESEDDEHSQASVATPKSDSTSIAQTRDLTPLSHAFLWELSSAMDVVNWRALGRSLGLDESVLLNIEHSYKTSGFRECAYQMLLHWKEKYPKKSTYGTLYIALKKEGMNAVAKKMKGVTVKGE